VDRSTGSVYLDNIQARTKTVQKTWTYAGDNGNAVSSVVPSFTAEQYTLLAAQPPSADDAQYDEDVLMPSLTPDEQAAIAVEDWG
jgi:hypothetical protein